MACLKEEFQSRIRINKFSIKKEFYLFGLWLEIFKDKNGIYIYINRKELDKIYTRICQLPKQGCSCCSRENSYICNRFKFIYEQYMHYIDNEKNKILWKIYLKTNEYDLN